jgi:hypothetical protein
MALRTGFFLVGNTVEIDVDFRNSVGQSITAGGIIIKIKKPDSALETFIIDAPDSSVAMNLIPDLIGRWFVRIECATPLNTATEGYFEVVPSRVI